jgi:hypothetical protein
MREGLNLESLKVKLRPSKQRIWPACMLSAASCKVLVDPRLLSKNHLTPPPRGAQGGCNPNPLPEIKMGIKLHSPSFNSSSHTSTTLTHIILLYTLLSSTLTPSLLSLLSLLSTSTHTLLQLIFIHIFYTHTHHSTLYLSLFYFHSLFSFTSLQKIHSPFLNYLHTYLLHLHTSFYLIPSSLLLPLLNSYLSSP